MNKDYKGDAIKIFIEFADAGNMDAMAYLVSFYSKSKEQDKVEKYMNMLYDAMNDKDNQEHCLQAARKLIKLSDEMNTGVEDVEVTRKARKAIKRK